MPNVLVLGATGYLGLAVAKALNRSGNYHVWGHTRSAAKAKLLEVNEIIPAVGDITNAWNLTSIIAKFRINVVVDATTTAGKEADKIAEAVMRVGKYQQDIMADMKTCGPKLGFVYVSRAGVHAPPELPILSKPKHSDTTEVQTIKAAPRRPPIERMILAARSFLDVAIIRPHAVYGHATPVLGQLWKDLVNTDPQSTEPIEIHADANLHLGVVHLDDVAAAFVTTIDGIHGRLGDWPVFDLWAESVRVDDIMEAAKAVLGMDLPLTYHYNTEYHNFDTWVLENVSDVSNARCVLGWSPRRVTFLADLRIYLRAYISAH